LSIIDGIFKAFKRSDEVVEVPEDLDETKQLTVRIETLRDFVDTERIARIMKEGNIVFLKVGELQKHDIGEFQNSVQKLKRFSNQFGWDIVGMEEGYLVITPNTVKIARPQ
jgi:SepF-like predicted cell division protein (DUF552 family)